MLPRPDRVIPARPSTSSFVSVAWLTVSRWLAIGALSGFAAGFVTGIWTRIAMRFSGMLTVDRNRLLLTESEAAVGRVTLYGTFSLAMFAAVVGVAGGLLYMAIRRWLPHNAWLRALAYGALWLGAFGFLVLDPGNSDFHRFGPAWFNVSTFSVAYLFYGAALSVFADRLDRLIPRAVPPQSSRWQAVAWTSGLAVFAALGLICSLMLILLIAVQDTARLILVPLVVVLLWRLGNHWLTHARIRERSARLVTLFALVATGAVGLFLTVQSVFSILSG